MPTPKMKKGQGDYYVQTSISGEVITFQLTGDGKQKVFDAGLNDGSRFSRALLLSLIQSGDAFTHGTGLRRSPESDQQLELDFPDDPYPEKALPACSDCSSPENLHLVAVEIPSEGDPDAYLLCVSCRKKKSAEMDVSIPIPLVSRFIFLRLQEWKLFRNPDLRVKAYGDALNTDFEKMWEEYRKKKVQPKTGHLPIEDNSQAKLFK
jgi:hypothetical protein